MLLLMLCYVIVATSVDVPNGRTRIRAKQKKNHNFSRDKWNKGMKETLILKTQSGGWTHLTSAAVADAVIVLLLLLIRRIIVWK